MDGVHDMGGMHGFGPVGPVPASSDEPVFHDWWEGHAFALSLIATATGLRTGSVRPDIEALDPVIYLSSSYYERWVRALEAGLLRGGTLTADDIDERAGAIDGAPPPRSQATSPDLVAGVRAVLASPGEGPSGVPVEACFAAGDRVTVRRMAPAAHHRCPRYVRGVTGVVERVVAGWPPPASDEAPEAVYNVRFAMRDLWGDDAEEGSLHIDLWERYLS